MRNFILMAVVATFVNVSFAESVILSIPENIEEVRSTRVDYVSYRAVLTSMEIYPSLDVDVFSRGSEGEDTEVTSSVNIFPGEGPDSDKQIELVGWEGTKLNFKINGQSCSFESKNTIKGSASVDPVCE